MTPCPIKVNQEPSTKVEPNPVAEAIRSHYDDLIAKMGMIPDASRRQIELNQEFIISVAEIADVQQLTKLNKVDNFLSKALGWKQYLWHMQKNTESGAVRKFLFDSSNASAEVVRLVAQQKALPIIETLMKDIVDEVGENLTKDEINELIMDYVAIGGYKRVIELTDSPPALDYMQQVIIKHQDRVTELGISASQDKLFTQAAAKISDTYDNLATLARQNGLDFEYIPGYVPLRATDEFQEALAREVRGAGKKYRSVEHALTEERTSNVPFVLNEEGISTLLKRQLLSEKGFGVDDLTDEAKVFLSKKSAELAEEEFIKNRELLDTALTEVRTKFGAKRRTEILRRDSKLEGVAKKLEQTKTKLSEAAATKQKNLEDAIQTTRAELRAAVQAGAEPAKISVLQKRLTRQKNHLAPKVSAIQEKLAKDLATADEKSAARAVEVNAGHKVKIEDLAKKEKESLSAATTKFDEKLSKTAKVIRESAEVEALLWDVASNPGQLTKLLSTLSEVQKNRLFDSGVLINMPALSGDLKAFYRSFDLGVDKLSDAIIDDPIRALRTYSDELAEAVRESKVVKDALYEGSQAGWVRSTPAEDFIPIQNLYQRIDKFIGRGESLGDGYIHRTVASQLESFLKLQSNPSELAMVGNFLVQVNNVFKKSALMSGGYLKRVLFSNVLSLYHATGSLAQLPVAFADYIAISLKHSSLGTKKVWEIGGKLSQPRTFGKRSCSVKVGRKFLGRV